MKKVVLIIAVLGIVGAGFWYWQNQSSQVAVIDCAVDTACFATNFRSCTLSKVYGGATEIAGGTPESCQVKFYTAENTFLNAPALNMECTVKNTGLFKDEEINAVGVIQKGSLCAGSMYEEYKKIPGLIKE